MAREYRNLNEILRWRADHDSDRPAFTFLKDGGEEELQWTYRELDSAARTIAARLQQSTSIGQRVILLYPPGLEFVAAFWGCLYAGVIAVPAYPVRSPRNMERIKNIARNSQPTAALTTRRGLLRMKNLMDRDLAALQWIETDYLSPDMADHWREQEISRDSIALLQYTSGSTGEPKGVVVSHGNLLHNEEAIQATFGQDSHSVIVGWLPLYHDMGLMGTMLQPVYSRARCVLMSPNAFLQHPFLWLNAISQYRATTSGGPNFAYDLCVRRITDEERARLDLSAWNVAFNGAEPVREETLEKFAFRFAGVGFAAKSFRPCYGLAEATLLVSGCTEKNQPAILTLDTAKLGQNRVQSAPARADATSVVSCGRIICGHGLAIVDPQTLTRCAPEQVGEIWIAGPSVAKGYWNRREESEHWFGAQIADSQEGPFLRTGDLGFIQDGNLFVTGRCKDLIIIRGRNHYPQDIEMTVQAAHPALRPGCGAAFSVEAEAEEQLVVLYEIEHGKEQQLDGMVDSIRQALIEQHEIQAHALLLLRAGTIPKTSSGKIQRYLCREQFTQGMLTPLLEWRSGSREAAIPILSRFIVPKTVEDIQRWLAEKFAARAGIAPELIQMDAPVTRYGLDSLATMELAHAMERELGRVVPLPSLMQEKSITELARELLSLSREIAAPAFEDARQETVAPELEEVALSPGQQSLWYLHQLNPESTAYNLAFVARILNGVDTQILRRVFQSLVDRHASLRTTFHSTAGEPFQRIHASLEMFVSETDVSNWSDSALKQRFEEEAETHFDLEQGPLFQVALFRRSDSECFIAMTLHHIIGDLWSLALLIRETAEMYAAGTRGETLRLPPLESSYSNYVIWQRKMLSGTEGARLSSYWTTQLAGELPVLELPTDRIRPTIQIYNGATKAIDLSPELSYGLKALARENGTTLYVILLAAFQILLHRYSGQTDILVGSPSANRSRAEWAGLFGYFVNPIVLRTRFEGNPPFSRFLSEVRDMVLEALEHQDYPFVSLVQQLQPERDPSRSPLFQSMFVFEKTRFLEEEGISAFALAGGGARLELKGLTLESVASESRKALFDLTLTSAELKGVVRSSFEYNTGLFDEETITRMAGHWRQLLQGIVASQTAGIQDLPLLTEEEYQQITEEWNRTGRDYPQRWVQDLFEEQVRRTPEAVAVEYEDRQLKYEELNRRANQLAHYLIGLGMGPETPVGVCMERSLELAVAWLGVQKAGGVYVPLEPDYPVKRLGYMLEESGAAVLLTQSAVQDRLGLSGEKTVRLDAEWEQISGCSVANVGRQVSGENLAYVIYTSGSTGRPKGTGITHRSLSNHMQWMQEEIGYGAEDRVLQKTALSFDASVWEFYGPLLSGGRVVLLRAGEQRDARYVGEEIVRRGITVVFLTPSFLQAVVESGVVEEAREKLRLRVLISGGEALKWESARAVWDRWGVEIVNLYGPTEATIDASCWRAGAEWTEQEIPIGRPIANTQLYVVDEEMKPVPVGVVGELYIGGAGLAREYLNRPGLTAESFVPNQYSGQAGSRLYRTGDRARWREDGNLEYLGRLDQQVKIRGYRIELGEIETALEEQAGVRQAVVVVQEEESGDKRLVAYVVGNWERDEKGKAEIKESELRQRLRGRLPEYMVPSAYVKLEELPLTSNGKLDRKRLPAPEYQAEMASPSTTPMEEILAGIWGEVLKLRQVSRSDNFFEIGGHSLLATQMITRIQATLGIELPLRTILEHQTVASLAEHVERLAAPDRNSQVLKITPVPRDIPLPLSFAQQRLWFLDQMEPGRTADLYTATFRFTGKLDTSVLERVLGEIVRRHEILRTSFRLLDGQPVQQIAPYNGLKIRFIDLSGNKDNEQAARALARAETAQAFDLSQTPLLRVVLVKLGEDDHLLLLTIHHIISDGWSAGVLMREFQALYCAFAQNFPSPLPELSIQYADFSFWQRQRLTDEVLEPQLDYWRRELAGAQVTALPANHSRQTPSSGAGQAPISFSRELTQQLQKFSRQHGVTLFMTVAAGFELLLGRYCGQKDVAIGTNVANRTRLDTEPLIGFFVNNLVLRNQLQPTAQFVELVQQVRRTVLGAYANQDLPFERLVEELAPARLLGRTPFFQALLVFQHAPQGELHLPGVEIRPWEGFHAEATWDLSLSLTPGDNGIRGNLEYAASLFTAESMERLAAHLVSLLERVTAVPETRLWEAPLLSQAEQRQLLEEWNAAHRSIPELCLHEIVEQQAERNPQSLALVFGKARLTYAELNGRANQVAHFLRELGVTNEVRVALCVERSPEMIIGLLGILKAGGAYVPLDPGYPVERMAWILEDSEAPILLTQESLRGRIPSLLVQVLALDTDWDVIAVQPQHNPQPVSSLQNLAYIIYTSGSTGKPKGVAMSHAGVPPLAVTHMERLGIRPGSRVLQFASLNFDASVWEIAMALGTGAALVLLREDERSGPALAKALAEQEVTHATLPPVVLATLEEKCERLTLETLIVGGEAWAGDLVARWAPGLRMVNAYGPTETTACSVLSAPLSGSRTPPIGVPVVNTTVYVLDEEMGLVPAGAEGELYIGGQGLARGYVNQPGLTATAFLPNPYAKCTGERLYKTGDQVKWLADGSLEYIGRKDDQVKIRGYRVELGEIEALLKEHDGIRQAVVLAREDEPGQKRLVAYVTAADENGTSANALRNALVKRLPEYMVPGVFVHLEKFPQTHSGKIDRNALPKPEYQAAPTIPRTAVEEIIAGIWGEVFRRNVGIQDDFFELGGHSLMATQVVLRIQAVFGIELPLRALFEGPTVAALAEQVEQSLHHDWKTESPEIVPVSRDLPLPLSYPQQRLWFLAQINPGNLAYNSTLTLRFEGKLNVEMMEQAIEEIVRRHEVLRTSFPDIEGQPIQRVHPFTGFHVPVIDLANAVNGVEAARELARVEAGRPFDLAHGPMLRITLVRLSADDHLLLIAMHHIISDGWSTGILVNEFNSLYAAYIQGMGSPLHDLPVQYGDFAHWQRSWLAHDVVAQQMQYWRKQLAGLAPLDLPTDHPRPILPSGRGGRLRIRIPAQLKEQLEKLSREHNVTLFMTLLATFQLLLARHCGQEDVAVGTTVANRTNLKTEPLIGFFVNVLVSRSRLEPATSFSELLRNVRRTLLDAYTHQDLPFELLVAELEPARALGQTPLFQTLISLLNTSPEQLQLPELKISTWDSGHNTVKFDLSLLLAPVDGVLEGTLEYAAELFVPQRIERMAGHFINLLERLATTPQARLWEIPLLSEAERRQLVEEWNATAREVSPLCVHELFEEHAELSPNRIAVVSQEGKLTYRDLNQRANCLAHYLQAISVGPEVRVALCMDRGLNLIVGLLAILKSGGAYVPIDANQPMERLGWMLKNSLSRIVLTESKLRDHVSSPWIQVICLDTEWSLVAAQPDRDMATTVPVESLAYAIYTSGSTGKPKCTGIEHRQLSNYVQAVSEKLRLRAGLSFALVSTFAADLGNTMIFPALCTGGTLHVIGDAIARNGSALHAWFQEHTIDFLKITPSHLAALLTPENTAGLLPASSLVIGGEASRQEWIDDLRRYKPATRILNHYGPTECTVGVSTFETGESGQIPPATVPLGKPLSNLRLYVLDEEGEPGPVGVAGEVYIGGAGVGRGYLNEAGMTAEKFVPDGVSGARGGRLYRSGDVGRWGWDGNLEYLERADQQVKVRGYRVELGEIEAVLQEHGEVKQSAVVLRGEGGEKRLVGYVTGMKGGQGRGREEELRSWVRKKLPEYMVPGAIVALEELPLTANGKLDRKRLPEAEERRRDAGEREEPLSVRERILAGIWGQVLGVEGVGRGENFFQLGGDSIQSIKVVTRAAQAGLELTVQQIFQHQTLGELAAAAGVRRERRAGEEEGEVTGVVPLTAIQEWFFEQELEQQQHFNQALLLEVKKGIGGERVGRAVKAVLKHHDAVRLRFGRKESGGWEQWYGEKEEPSFVEVDLSGAGRQEQKERMEGMAGEMQRSLELRGGPMGRGVYFHLGEGQTGRLLVVLHHLIVDGVSWRILVEDVHTALQQVEAAGEVMLLGQSMSWQRWAEAVREWVGRGELEAEEGEYWLKLEEQKKEGGKGRLPLDYEGGRNTVESSGREERELSEAETGVLLRQGPGRLQAQMQEMLLTGLAGALAEWSGQEGVLVEMEGHGREAVIEGGDVSRTVGWFTTHYPVWVGVGGETGVAERLRRVKAEMERVPRHGIGYGLLRYVSGKEEVRKRMAELPRPEVIFNYLGQMDETLPGDAWLGLAPESAGETQDGRQKRGYVFEVSASLSGGRLRIGWRYGRELHRQATVQRLADAFMENLRDMAALCSPDEKQSNQAQFPMARLKVAQLRSILEKIGQQTKQ
jgi:amino acid adenylation domain-containing protein/non-ribosomal peptide synthase protein (TIGR01720 family)